MIGPAEIRLYLTIGALANKLGDQLREQGLRLPANQADLWQMRIDSLIRLEVAGVITPGESDRVANRILKAIAKEIEPNP